MPEPGTGWRRLSWWALLPITTRSVVRTVREHLPAILGAGAGFTFIEALGLREFGLGLLALLLIVLLGALFWHRRFRFRVTAAGVQVRQGVLKRREVRVDWDRVRNVDLRQPLYFRPLGIVGAVLETAGGQSEEVCLDAIPLAEAEQLRESVGQQGGDPRPGTAADNGAEGESGELLHQPAPRDLFLHGVVSGQLWFVFAALGGLYGSMAGRIHEHVEEFFVEYAGAVAPESTAQLVLLSAAGLVVLAMLLVLASGLVARLRYHAYRLVRDGDRFRARHGLFETRERSLRREKLQGLTLVQTATGRMLGRCHLLGQQASANADYESGSEFSDATVVVPGLSLPGASTLMALIDPGSQARPPLNGVAAVFCRYWWTRLWLLVLVAALGLLALWGGERPVAAPVLGAAAILAAPLLLWPVVRRRWRQWGWAVIEDEWLQVREGFIGRQWQVFHLDRVQQVRVRQAPFQRRHDVADLQLWLAHGQVVVPFLPRRQAVRLANRVLFHVETAAGHRI